MEEENNLKGLKGWLIFIGLGLVVSPLRLAAEIGPMFYKMFTDGSFEYLTTPGTESYNPLWEPLLIFEASYNGFMILFAFFLAYLFFKKHYQFPKLYIVFAILPVILIPMDAWLSSLVLKNEEMFDAATAKEMVRALLGAIVWIPYMLVSKRVKITFVEGRSVDAEQVKTPEDKTE
ncbi:DUF2569 domain-containing protein [Leptospira ognonensis]|uniref:DUF2569 domain-containing protein n=1 Tax=Leptospira ognonensis TaxID=2484945 RepID=A0A4R9JZT8_9LEPT|nr:DUF2569 domain-containing protein [Leptospira ognonensis]TGL57918.1 DUF2569 domain-containing protein [Leptospira ognonensis]